jgi:hypothetical protein
MTMLSGQQTTRSVIVRRTSTRCARLRSEYLNPLYVPRFRERLLLRSTGKLARDLKRVSKLQSSEDALYILRTKASELRQPIDPVKRENPNAISAE